MKRIITHPANRDALQRSFEVIAGAEYNPWGFEITYSEHVERNKPTGKYIVAGKVVELEDVRAYDRFVEYGPEDIDWLVYAGHVVEEETPCFIVMEDPIRVRARMGFEFPKSPLWFPTV